MKRLFVSSTLVVLLCGGLSAATTNTTLTVDASGALSGTSVTATGTASLTSIGNGSFTATLSFASVSGQNLSAPFTITLSGGNLTGTLLVPLSILSGTSSTVTGSATVTGGTGSYAGATGSFPSLTGTGGISTTTGAITMHFTGAGTITTGGTGGGGGGGGTGTGTSGPTITDVLDAGSYTKNIAEGSIFVVKGSGLSASGFTQLSFPLPTTSSGVKITFTPTSGGQGTDAYLIYLYNQSNVNQLAAILPSTVATGNYNVTVTNGTASAPFPVTVVQRKPGIITQDSTGTGLAVVQNYISASQLDVNRFTVGTISGITISPARPGQVLIAWLTGLGPVSGSENTASAGHDFLGDNVDIQVIVNGRSIKPLYAGRAPGLSGADQVNFVLPGDIDTGCTVSFQVSVAGQLSNPSFISIAPNASANACVAPGLTTEQLLNFDQGNSVTVGSFSLSQIAESIPGLGSASINNISGGFTKITGFQLSSAGRAFANTATNGCLVIHQKGTTSQLSGGGSGTQLDAGTVTLTGPAGSNLTGGANLTKDATNGYSLSLGGAGLPSLPGSVSANLVAGTYSLAGKGGADVGQFNASVNLGSPLTVTGGLPTTVTRSAGLTLNWTGGNSSDVVSIIGIAGQNTGTGANAVVDATMFVCTTTAGPGTFTVPASILNQLPAVSAAAMQAGTATGFLQIGSFVTPSSGNGLFTAPLTAGGTANGTFLATFATGTQAAFQ